MLTRESKYSDADESALEFGPSAVELLSTTHMSELARVAREWAESQSTAVGRATQLIAQSFGAGHKLLACGNGGSAADAQHMVGELIGRVSYERAALPAVSLTADTVVLTALANDYGYEEVFARQVRGLGSPGDVLVVLSTSGRSPSVVRAVHDARSMAMTVISLTGPSADPTLELADAWISVDSPETTHIQEIHAAAIHIICLGVERLLRQSFEAL